MAYVVFKNPSRVQAAISLSPHEPLLMSSESCPVKTGILSKLPALSPGLPSSARGDSVAQALCPLLNPIMSRKLLAFAFLLFCLVLPVFLALLGRQFLIWSSPAGQYREVVCVQGEVRGYMWCHSHCGDPLPGIFRVLLAWRRYSYSQSWAS